jgi:RimJ/RimL family protein N-acetyltransferase
VTAFVPAGFDPPTALVTDRFVLRPLGPQHNDADFEAWTSSVDHIRATPGFVDGSWPREMTPAENLADLERHERDFGRRQGFTFTVLDPASGGVIGCVYIYPSTRSDRDADARSWVRASHAELDGPLRRAVADWLADEWPFQHVDVPGLA